jgi:hypothetical protein
LETTHRGGRGTLLFLKFVSLVIQKIGKKDKETKKAYLKGIYKRNMG